MAPWHVRLVKRISGLQPTSHRGDDARASAWEGALESQYEKGKKKQQHVPVANSNRELLFGPAATTMARACDIPEAVRCSSDTDLSKPRELAALSRGGGVRFGGGQQMMQRQAQQGMQMMQRQMPMRQEEDEDEQGRLPDDTSMVSADTVTGTLAFQESSRESHGLITTYGLPGLRTLGPGHLKRRHLIADLSLTSISLSYMLTPKLRTAAFPKAQIRNTSSITLLRGRAVHSSSRNRAINVTYAKPTVRRSLGGIFNKEESMVYTRAITVANNKQQNEPVELVVLDQIPDSEDEQLRMTIVEPSALRNVGDRVKTGEPVTAGQQWGKAIATLKKDGEVVWNVTLNKGARCRLPLEYEAKIPASEIIVGLS
ncbi:MAG: hypothetical protein M1816_007151 [Peltula sp. TS41687]|nr:MAG: hypothetical protein M1816_007151 [Peltula sp. TS41687]